MEKQTFGRMIAELRKSQGMTQLELAEKMGVTDKAVSKWERDLSYPDVGSIPKLAEIFGVKGSPKAGRLEEIIELILKAVAVAMGIATAVLSFLGQIEADAAIGMLGIGLACLAVTQLPRKQ